MNEPLAYGIIWSCPATGAECDYFGSPISREEAETKCAEILGTDVFFNGEKIGVVETAYPATKDGDYL